MSLSIPFEPGSPAHAFAKSPQRAAEIVLVADQFKRKADQDQREGREPRPLCRLPNGRGRHPTQLFQEILWLIADLRPQPPPAPV
jgi:hypothetical protein